MSAWIVSEKHILTLAYYYNKLVTETIRRYGNIPEEVDIEKLKPIAKILWKQNYKSVNWRYNERRRMRFSQVGTVLPETNLTIEELVKQIYCWEYQSCENPKYNSSKAFKMMDELKIQILGELMRKSTEHNQAYQDAPWGI